MTWFFCISELCFQVCEESTIKDILETAVVEQMLTESQADDIAKAVGVKLCLEIQ